VRSRSLLWSFNYAIEGIIYALRTQRNMRLHVFAAIVVLVGAVVFHVTTLELIGLLFAISLVFAAELANTALEAAIDVAVDRYDPLAKVAKDVAAGAVLVASMNALAVGYLVFFGRLRDVVGHGMTLVREPSSAGITVAALGLTTVVTLVVKAITRTGSFLRGGWPSGHVALATAAAAAVGYATMSPAAFMLALFIAALVAQSRVEGNVHTIPQVIVGALLGFLIATAAFQLFFL
jgi:diacylglycerol kinase (ATP)